MVAGQFEFVGGEFAGFDKTVFLEGFAPNPLDKVGHL